MHSSHRAARGLVAAAAIALLASPAIAHDFWLAPSELVLDGDREVTISLLVGEGLVAEQEKPFDPGRFPRLVRLHAGRTEDLIGSAVANAKPMLRLPVRGAGGHLLVVDRSPSRIELEPKKFEAYLREEGLEAIIGERAKLGESTKPGRERYSRNLKALIQVGATRDETYRTVLDQTLELVPESNPAFIEPGGTLSVVVRFRGKPLAGAELEAFGKGPGGTGKASHRTDAAGRVKVAIDRRGTWLLRLVHMERCQACPDADWESFWTAYTFGNGEPTAAGAAPAAGSAAAPAGATPGSARSAAASAPAGAAAPAGTGTSAAPAAPKSQGGSTSGLTVAAITASVVALAVIVLGIFRRRRASRG